MFFVFVFFIIIFIVFFMILSSSSSSSPPQGPGNCTKCANLQDGLFCVSRCPQDLQGQDESRIWKYADHRNVCQLCHKNCTQG